MRILQVVLALLCSSGIFANITPSIYYHHPDHLGSATWITDMGGTPMQYLHYMPYGETFAEQSVIPYRERFRFTGKERDEETNYDYFGARYYSSAITSWLSVDPLSDKYPDVSPYAYCSWNPMKYVDPDGREWKDIEGNIIKDHSNIKAYIFYNPKDFKSQSYSKAIQSELKYGRGSVAMSEAITESEFSKDWKAMGGR